MGLRALLLGIAVATAFAALDPFAAPAKARVFIFVRTDCPISNRYAPELIRLSHEFTARGAAFFIVYADPSESSEAIERNIQQYGFPGQAIRDPSHSLVRRAKATITPESAVFSAEGKLLYHGRIDNRYLEPGKAMPSPTHHDLEDAIAATLAGKPLPEAYAPAVGCYLADVE
jgi:AhpC/TSA family